MSEYECSMTINASMRQIEDFITDVKNLPRYLPTTQNAMPEPGERVRVQGEAHGHHYDSDGYFHVDKSKNRMEWGSDGEEKYRGWLVVDSEESGKAKVTVHLSFEPSPTLSKGLAEQTGSQDEAIQRDLENSLRSIKNIMEGRGGKVKSVQD